MVNANSTRRMRAGILMLALFAVFAGAFAPLCDALCCPLPTETAMHAIMPCCAGEDSVTRSESMRLQRAALTPVAKQAPEAAPVAAVVVAESAHADTASLRHVPPRLAGRHEPSPPLFLLHAQFLI